MSSLFEFDRVRVVRDGMPMLTDVSVTIPDTGITTVIGESGSGKSSATP